MRDLLARISDADGEGAETITVDDVALAIDCAAPPDVETAELFNEFIKLVASWANPAKASGCDVVLQAGGIPVIFHSLRAWPEDCNVLTQASFALNHLARHGSSEVKAAMLNNSDCQNLLTAIPTKCYDSGAAWGTLSMLGFSK